MENELRPCRCGSTNVEYCTMLEIPSVRCYSCGEWLLKYGGTKEEVISAWNTRANELDPLDKSTVERFLNKHQEYRPERENEFTKDGETYQAMINKCDLAKQFCKEFGTRKPEFDREKLIEIIKHAKIDGHAFHHPIVMLHVDNIDKLADEIIGSDIWKDGE